MLVEAGSADQTVQWGTKWIGKRVKVGGHYNSLYQ
jgi:hypothetical protein